VIGAGDPSATHGIAEQLIEEERVVGEVAFEEAAGFHGEAGGPLEAEALEDGRGPLHLAGVEGEAAPVPSRVTANGTP